MNVKKYQYYPILSLEIMQAASAYARNAGPRSVIVGWRIKMTLYDEITRKETPVKIEVKKYLKENGYTYYSGFPTGFPDALVLGNGRCFWIEFKRPIGGTLSTNQLKIIRKLRDCGQTVWCITSLEEFKELEFKND